MKKLRYAASITRFGARTALGKQACGFGALALESLASGHFGVNPQRAQYFQPVALFEHMVKGHRFAPNSGLPILHGLGRESCRTSAQKNQGLFDGGACVGWPHHFLNLSLGSRPHNLDIHR
jgi:hypothetical protein